MKDSILRDLHQIADYVAECCKYDVRTEEKSRLQRRVATVYLFHVLAREHTIASYTEIGSVSNRNRATVYVSLRDHSEYAKNYFPQEYKGFNPFKVSVKSMENPFSPTIEVLYKAKEQLERDIDYVNTEKKYMADYILRQVKNEKVFEVLKMVKHLDNNQLDAVLDRLPPIIKMTE